MSMTLQNQPVDLGYWEARLQEIPGVPEFLSMAEAFAQRCRDADPLLRDVTLTPSQLSEAVAGVLAAVNTLKRPAEELWLVEWGAGFGGVAGAAALMGVHAVGIEANVRLVQLAGQLWREQGIEAELWHGNFLPDGSHALLEPDDPIVSTAIQDPSAYARYGRRLDQFDIVFGYPWPGEERFLAQVFAKHGGPHAIMVMYRGPYHVELWRPVDTSCASRNRPPSDQETQAD